MIEEFLCVLRSGNSHITAFAVRRVPIDNRKSITTNAPGLEESASWWVDFAQGMCSIRVSAFWINCPHLGMKLGCILKDSNCSK